MRKAVSVGMNFPMIPATITDGLRRLSNRGKPRLIPQRKGEKNDNWRFIDKGRM